jgi:FKBP-type peptidyl-prolyl cis-trans isomerase
MEVAAEKAGTKDVADSPVVTLPSGVSYRELRVGGGQQPSKGLLVVLDYM